MVYYSMDPSHPLSVAAFVSILDTAMMLTLGYGALWARGFENRATQTITALAGTGVIIILLAIPVALVGGDLSLILFYCLIFWSIGIIGFILHHALSIALGWGIGISFLFFILQKNIYAVIFMPAQ